MNLNDQVHSLGTSTFKLVRTSWDEYVGGKAISTCSPGIILDQFESLKDYQKFAEETLPGMLEMRPIYQDLKNLEL